MLKDHQIRKRMTRKRLSERSGVNVAAINNAISGHGANSEDMKGIFKALGFVFIPYVGYRLYKKGKLWKDFEYVDNMVEEPNDNPQ